MPKIILIFESVLDVNGGPNKQVFIEANDEHGKSISVGEWAADGEYETLTIDLDKFAPGTANIDKDELLVSLNDKE